MISLQVADFSVVTILLLLETARLASAIFFSRLVTKPLIKLSQDPPQLKDKDNQAQVALLLRVLSQIAQLIFLLPSIVLPAYRLPALLAQYNGSSSGPNLVPCIQVFYIIVLANASVALLAVLCSTFLLYCLYDPVEQSILMYYDEILRRAFDVGFALADDFEFLSFAFTKLGQDLSRNVQPKVMCKHYKRLIDYLYAHRQGLDELVVCFDSDSSFKQRAAICIVGFWAEHSPLGVPLRLPERVLTKLADRLAGTGQMGWDVANTFSRLWQFQANSPTFLNVKDTTSHKTVADRMGEMIDPFDSRSLVFVRALANFYTAPAANKESLSPELEEKLLQIVEWTVRQRVKVLAAWLLMHVGKPVDACVVESIDPLKDDYFLERETKMLDELRAFNHVTKLDWEDIMRNGTTMSGAKFQVREDS